MPTTQSPTVATASCTERRIVAAERESHGVKCASGGCRTPMIVARSAPRLESSSCARRLPRHAARSSDRSRLESPLPSPDRRSWPAPTRPARSARSSAPVSSPTRSSTTGANCRRALKYGNTHGVCEDRQGNIYVHHTVNATSERHDTMVVFDRNGRFVRSWGNEFEGGAHGLHIRREGSDEFLYLCDTKRALVTKVTPRGETVWQLGLSEGIGEVPSERGRHPGHQVFADQRGDRTKRRRLCRRRLRIQLHQPIRQCRRSTFARSAGRAMAPGQLDCPHGLTVDTRGATPMLLVADRSNKRLQTFSLAANISGSSTASRRPVTSANAMA